MHFLNIHLSSMSPSSWLMDSAYCKHMTPHLSLFSQLEPASHPLNIYIVNSFTMFVHNIGSILTFNLSIPRVFNVPNLSCNFFFFFFFFFFFVWDNQLNWVIALPLIILGVLYQIRGCDRSLGLVLELGICFSWTTFVFHLLLLFLLLLQLLRFLLYLLLHFGMTDSITHIPLGYNTQLLEVCYSF